MADRPLRVFISYARRDCSEFAEHLFDGLEVAGFEPFLDRQAIAPGEDWELRLSKLIDSADTVLFVVSPAAIESERCAWEVETALTRSKRIIPAVAIEVANDRIPAKLARLNFVFFTKQSFPRALKELATALSTDLDWIREHTRLGELALRWKDKGQPASMLIRGEELEAAAQWLARAPDSSAVELHRDFISKGEEIAAASLELERKRLAELGVEQVAKEEALRKLSRRTTLGLAGSGILVAAAAGFAFWGMNAESRFEQERKRADEALQHSIKTAIAKEALRTDLTGQIVGYAAALRSSASDGNIDSSNSPYTAALIEQLSIPDQSLFAGLMRATDEVVSTTSGEQRPFVSSSMNGEIYLHHPSSTRKLTALVVSVSQLGASFPRLRNPVNDGDAWQRFLKARGFDTSRLIDPDSEDFSRGLLTAFPADVVPAGLTVPLVQIPPIPDILFVLVFAGPGFSINGVNYLGAYGTDPSDAGTASSTAIHLERLGAQLSSKFAATAMILDTGFPAVTFPDST